MNTTIQSGLDLATIKARQKATWESGDFGQIAKYTMPSAEEFMGRLELRPGDRRARRRLRHGQSRRHRRPTRTAVTAGRGHRVEPHRAGPRARASGRAWRSNTPEGDAEALPYPDASFDVVVSMYGVMFAPRPDRVVSELLRVTKPGGLDRPGQLDARGFHRQDVRRLQTSCRRRRPDCPHRMLWGDEDDGAGAASR